MSRRMQFIAMENPVRNILTEEPFRKRWYGPTTIISDEELKHSDSTDGAFMAENERNNNNETAKRTKPHVPDIQILSDENSSNKEQAWCRSHNVQNQCSQNPEIFRTPQKKCLEPRQYNCNTPKINTNATILCENSDSLSAERPNSWSTPSKRSPILALRSPLVHRVSQSPNMHKSCDIFNFSPERTERYLIESEAQSRLVKKRLFDDLTSGTTFEQHTNRELQSPVCCTALNSPSHRPRDILMPHRQSMSRDTRDLMSTREQQDTEIQYYRNSVSSRCDVSGCSTDAEPYLAKRRLDVDDSYLSTPKRLKIDLERQMGQRYLKQLESDISKMKQLTNCTCAIMERQFLEMAESAYRSVRRVDDSPRGFEQFRRELIQTNEVMKDSMDVLKEIKSFCEHKCNLR